MNNEGTKDRERLLAKRDEFTRKVEEVRGLLAKADARLREDPQNRQRWMSVVENLEASLGEVRARLAGIEADLIQLSKGGATTPPPDAEPVVAAPPPAEPRNPVLSADRKSVV